MLAALGVVLLAVDDVQPLRVLGGGILASPGWVPLLAAGLVVLPGSRLHRRKYLLLCAGALLAYAFLLTLVTCVLEPSVVYGEVPADKAVRTLSAFAIWILVLIAGVLLVRAVPRALLVGVGVALLLMLVGALLYRLGNHAIDDWSLIHSAANEQQRVRSTRFEASSLGGGTLAMTALAVLLVQRRAVQLVIGLAGLVLTVVLTDSRGTEIIAVAGVAVLVVLTAATGIWLPSRRTVAVAVVVVVGLVLATSLGLAALVQSEAWKSLGLSDAARGTSDATRAGWAFASTQVLVSSPLGLGFGAYLHETPRLLDAAIRSLGGVYDPQALAELARSASGVSDEGVSPKSGPTLAAFHLGWIGVGSNFLLWIVVLRRAWGTPRSPSVSLAVCVLSVMLVAAGYYSSLTAWEQALLFGAVLGSVAAPSRGRHAAARASSRRLRIRSSVGKGLLGSDRVEREVAQPITGR